MKRICALIGIFLLFACSGNRPKDSVQDKRLSLQVMKAKSTSEETEYKIRIFYDSRGSQIDQKKLTESMWYKQDSSFYRLEGTNKKYADAIIPVPNGLKNCFEYIVIFNNTKDDLDNNNLTYKDKYITGKAYQLSLK